MRSSEWAVVKHNRRVLGRYLALVILTNRFPRDLLQMARARRVQAAGVAIAYRRYVIDRGLSHLRFVGIRPGHQKDWLSVVRADRIAVPLRIFEENRSQCRMNGTLTAVHHDRGIKQATGRIEANLIVGCKRVSPDRVWAKIGTDIMPVQSRAADGD